MTEEQIKALQSTGGDHLAATEKNILGNDLNRLWATVKDLREKTGGRIDFVLDNAGFELYCDMVYGLWYSTCSRLLPAYEKLALSRLFVAEWPCYTGPLPW